MDLFEHANNRLRNQLPYDGIVHYHGQIMSCEDANFFFERLFAEIDWQRDEAVIFGKKILTQRKVAWYADEPFPYTYSRTVKKAKPWVPVLLQLRDITQHASQEHFNSCLLNLYHNGCEGMSWHSDAERELKKQGTIASCSFGAERKFLFKHKKTKEKVSIMLQHGSLLLMKGTTQSHWLHCLPPTKLIHTPRINLTFRTIDVEGSDKRMNC